MKTIHMLLFRYGLVVLSAMILLSTPAVATSKTPIMGDTLPVLNLPAPENPKDQEYLGIAGGGTFQIPRIKANVVIVEIYSLYCPYCQKEAPLLNSLYEDIENDPDLKGKIKLIGIGAGNSAFEVEVFRTRYQVPFPLFPDEKFEAHRCLGETRTPYIIAVVIRDDGSHEVIYSNLGSIEQPKKFLKTIGLLSGLEKGGSK